MINEKLKELKSKIKPDNALTSIKTGVVSGWIYLNIQTILCKYN